MMELLIISTDTTVIPEAIRIDDAANIDELIDRARERSREGVPRFVVAVVDGLEVARFAGVWMWTRPVSAPSSFAPMFRE